MRWLHRVPVPRASWAVYHPGVRRVALHPSTKLLVKNGPRVSFIQTRTFVERTRSLQFMHFTWLRAHPFHMCLLWCVRLLVDVHPSALQRNVGASFLCWTVGAGGSRRSICYIR